MKKYQPQIILTHHGLAAKWLIPTILPKSLRSIMKFSIDCHMLKYWLILILYNLNHTSCITIGYTGQTIEVDCNHTTQTNLPIDGVVYVCLAMRY